MSFRHVMRTRVSPKVMRTRKKGMGRRVTTSMGKKVKHLMKSMKKKDDVFSFVERCV